MSNTLPVSGIVNVSVSLTPAGAQAQSLSNLLVLGTSSVIDTTERHRLYSTLAAVASDFGLLAKEYLAAVKWFSQSPQPTSLVIGRWVNAASKGGLRCATLSAAQQAMTVWNVITTGSFNLARDGAAAADVNGLNFSSAPNLNAVASLITTALSGITCTWNANYSRFEFESSTPGGASAISFLANAAAGTPIAALLGGTNGLGGYLYQGQALESAVSAVALMDNNLGQQWYGLNIPDAVNSDHLAVSAYIEAANVKHIYGITTQEAGVLSAVSTADIAYQMKALAYRRTMVQYSSSDALAVISAMARIMTTDYTGNATVITLKFKREQGVVAEALNTNQASAAEAKNANIFVRYSNDTAIIEQGVMADGTFVDIVTGTDWLAIIVQREVYNLLYTSTTKIPQTDQGMQLLTTAVEAVCNQAVANGLLAPGVWNAGGFGLLAQGDYLPKGYYIYNAPVSSQLQADRTARLAMPIQVAAKLAGAIHSANVAITVNQ